MSVVCQRRSRVSPSGLLQVDLSRKDARLNCDAFRLNYDIFVILAERHLIINDCSYFRFDVKNFYRD